MSRRVLFCTITAVIIACSQKKQDTVPTPFDRLEALNETYTPLRITEIKPGGWIKEQIHRNLDGFTGRLDTLAPALALEDKIYGEDRLTKKVKSKDVGAVADTGAWQVQFLWWNSETQSNWRDGYIRSAIMTNDARHLEKLKNYIAYILSTQDSDGYLGIYDTDLRYRFDNENGELWAKASLLRGLLAWFEYTDDPALLAAIERAVQNVMDNYPVEGSHPFYSRQPYVGGTSHGLIFTDVLESLYRITGKDAYRDYAFFLYKDFSTQVLNEDAQYAKLVNDTIPLTGHGVHTYEHLRSLASAYYASGNPLLAKAIEKFLVKINRETTASGAAVGDEWIGGRKADATTRGYEYCSLHELMHSYLDLFIKTGDPSFAEKAEKLFFNAAQSARHPEKSCIAYLKSDNSYEMTGGLNGDNRDKKQTRYSYSPVHQEAAVCCVPNAGRIAPYFVQHMWLKSNRSLVASLLGPSTVSTSLNGNPVVIEEQTNYPYDNAIRFVVTANQSFALKIRKPEWATKFSASVPYKDEDGFLVIEKAWKGVESVDISFDAKVAVRQDLNGENYFTYGALVLAAPIPANEEQGKAFPIPGFFNYRYAPKKRVTYEYSEGAVESDTTNLRFTVSLINSLTKKKEPVELVPMGGTILRQVTFRQPKLDSAQQ